MGDIICAKCGEPWDAYGVRNGDMEAYEAEKFLKGEGCPSCHFGSRCPQCDGTGILQPDWPYLCATCRDRGYVSAWSPSRTSYQYRSGELYTGYSPNVRHIDASVHENPITLGVRKFPKRDGGHYSADGYVEEWWVQCPEGCAEKKHEPCPWCNGTGAFTPDTEEDIELDAAKSEIDNSDEDPMEILERRGLI